MRTRLRGRVNTRNGALLFSSTEFSRRGRRFAVTRGACRQGEESRRREGEDDKDGEGKRGKRMFARK